jgi:hypothetical protein
MSWVELFAAFLACHLAGDFVVQTDWQATHKRGGLGSDAVARRALFSHITTYTLCFVPVLAWVAAERDLAAMVGTAALIALPHLAQDDGRLLASYARRVKGLSAARGELSMVSLDQSVHVLTLFAIALWVGF